MSKDPRKIALLILSKLQTTGNTLDHILESGGHETALLDKRDRALMHSIVYGVLRWRGRLDWIIGHFSKISFRKIDSTVLNILRIGAYQIVYLDRVPDSAAVNTAVEMAKETAPPWVVRFVNGVLRNIARNRDTTSFPSSHRDPVSAIATGKSFPKWLIRRWVSRFGVAETENLCDAVNSIPPITLRTNTLKTPRQSLLNDLQDCAEKIEATPVAPDGLSIWNLKTPIPEMVAFKDGRFQVQDEAAQLISLLLDPQPGESILDACAGLGGKTGHIAQLMKNCGNLIALDKNPEKLQRLTSEMDRLGVSIATTRRHDHNSPIHKVAKGPFHRVLLDAPCSGLGVLRRNPDTKWAVTEKHVKQNSKRQLLFLQNLAHLVIPSGILVYAVCTIEPEETENVVKEFLKRHPEFAIDKDTGGLPDSIRSLMDSQGILLTIPHRNHMDGFFSVRFKRIA